MSAVKGIGSLFLAIKELVSGLTPASPTPVFLFVSQPPRSNTTSTVTFPGAVQSFVDSLGISPWTVIKPYVQPSLVPSLLKATDVVVAPFLNHISETLGLAALEAMAMAKPVVHCGVGGMRDYSSFESSVIVTPTCTPQNLASALSQVLHATPQQRLDLGLRARQVARRWFSNARWFRELFWHYIDSP